MNREQLIEEVLFHLHDALQEMKEMDDEEPYEGYETDAKMVMSLIEKIPRSAELSKDEAYAITRFLPGNYANKELVKQSFVLPYIGEDEICERDILQGDYDNLLVRFEEAMGIRKKRPLH